MVSGRSNYGLVQTAARSLMLLFRFLCSGDDPLSIPPLTCYVDRCTTIALTQAVVQRELQGGRWVEKEGSSLVLLGGEMESRPQHREVKWVKETGL